MSEPIIVFIDEDLKEIVPSFLDNRRKDITLIATHLPNQEWTHIESIAHKLAGNAGSYGFNDLGQIGAKLEQACQEGNTDEATKLCAQYKEYIEHLKVEFK